MTAIAGSRPSRRRFRYGGPALLDDWFRGTGMAPLWRESDVTTEIRVDITEGEKVYTLEAEIPGVDKRDIEVSVDGNQVSIRAERKREKRERDEKEIVVERSFGKAYRSFALPGDVDGNRTGARYDKGVLTLMLPRKMNGTARRITVS